MTMNRSDHAVLIGCLLSTAAGAGIAVLFTHLGQQWENARPIYYPRNEPRWIWNIFCCASLGFSLGALAGLASSNPKSGFSFVKCLFVIAVSALTAKLITEPGPKGPHIYSNLCSFAGAMISTGILIYIGNRRRRNSDVELA